VDAAEIFGYVKSFGLPVAGAVAGWVFTSMKVKDRVRKLEQGLVALRKGWRLELDSHKEEATAMAEALKKELKELEEKLETFQRESKSFASDEEMNRFIEETQRQWQQIQRTLGQIEGWMKKLP
jgi:Tfp pilus assembly protein PilO